jgi:ketosteroid isomerase-like protein
MPEEPTTPDLVERLQRFIDATNAADFDAMASFYAHDAVYDARRADRSAGKAPQRLPIRATSEVT